MSATPARTTVARFWEDAAQAYLDRCDADEKRDMRSILDHLLFFGEHFGGRLLSEITDADIADAIDAKRTQGREVKATGGGTRRRPVATCTLNRYYATFAAVMNNARLRGWVNRVPYWRKFREKGRVEWLTHEEWRAVYQHLPQHLKPLAEFAVMTGLRQSNVTHLRWAWVDMDNRQVVVPSVASKSGRAMTIPMNDRALEILRSRWERRTPDDEFVFPHRGKPIVDPAQQAWKQALSRAGLPPLRWHCLRHSWASWHAQAGTPPQVLQRLGGWQQLTMVERYSHLQPSFVAEFANAILPKTATEPAAPIAHALT